jgi:hypothetical protein
MPKSHYRELERRQRQQERREKRELRRQEKRLKRVSGRGIVKRPLAVLQSLSLLSRLFHSNFSQ